MIVAHYNGNAWEKVGTTPIITGDTYSGSVKANVPSTSFSPFTLGSGTGMNPLPVDLVSFTANCNYEHVDVAFSVASQVNNHHFIIERSMNGMEWEEVGTLQGAGNNGTLMDYSFVDYDPIIGLSYYRLTQVDYDGALKIFYPVSTSCGASDSRGLPINAYPNPAVSQFTVELDLEELKGSNVYYSILDFKGTIVASDQLDLSTGYNKHVINISKLSAGVYTFRIHNTYTPIAETRIIKR
jgi:hypothetical protein